jgi:hypothetical protein
MAQAVILKMQCNLKLLKVVMVKFDGATLEGEGESIL